MILKDSRPYLYLLNAIKWHVLIVSIVVIVTAVLGEYLDRHTDIEHPIGIPAFFGTAIVFVLAFRTNQAYDRWWEARKIWGGIVNTSRTWSRMTLTLIDFTPETDDVRRRLIKRQVAWSHILSFRLRQQQGIDKVKEFFSEEEYKNIKQSENPNQLIIFWQSRDLCHLLEIGQLDEWHHIEFEECLKDFEALMGKAERIKNTHFPVLYDHLIHFSIFVFASLLAFAIVDSSHFFEVTFTTVLSAIFLAMEHIAREMQDPFEDEPSDTPMSTIAHSIESGAMQLLGEDLLSPTPVKGKFYAK